MLLPILLFANIINIPMDYTTIQEGIDFSVAGDTVIVHPGMYYENIEFSNKSNVSLCSLEATTGDTTYVSLTIINGSLNEDSTISCYENLTNCEIRGLSITGGSGHIFWDSHDINSDQVFGGGIFCYSNIDIIIKNCNIFENKSSKGGGIWFGHDNIQCNISNVNIFNNIGRCIGGGVCFASSWTDHSNVIFDQVNRCSIYNNYSPQGMDIGWSYNHFFTQDIYLDMFTWHEPSKYYVNIFDYDYTDITNPFPVFDIQQSYITPVESDLYVSMNGDDTNSGLTPEDPLRTTWKAFQQINPTVDNPLTVHLLEGDFTEIINGCNTTIVLKENTTLHGVSPEMTHLFADSMVEAPVGACISYGSHQSNMSIENLSITVNNGHGLGSYTAYHSDIDNVVIRDSNLGLFTGAMSINGYEGDLRISNVSLINNTSYINSGLNLGLLNLEIDSLYVRDCITEQIGTTPAWGVYNLSIKDTCRIKNSTFINNYLNVSDYTSTFQHNDVNSNPSLFIDNCLYSNNTTSGSAYTILMFGDYESINILNTTFANNQGVYENFITTSDSLNVYNCIFANNEGHTYQLDLSGNSNVDNCLFTDSENLYTVFNGDPINFGANNLVGTDPLFVGGDPAFPEYYYLSGDDTEWGPSPAIDAGTTDLNLFPANYEFPLYDLAGEDRIYGSSIDIGCYEFPGYTNSQDDVISLEPYSLTNYPNPFNPTTNISFTLPTKSKVEIAIYNVKGQKIKTLCDDEMESGEHKVVWNGVDDDNRTVSSGIYFCKMKSRGKSITTKMVLMK